MRNDQRTSGSHAWREGHWQPVGQLARLPAGHANRGKAIGLVRVSKLRYSAGAGQPVSERRGSHTALKEAAAYIHPASAGRHICLAQELHRVQ